MTSDETGLARPATTIDFGSAPIAFAPALPLSASPEVELGPPGEPVSGKVLIFGSGPAGLTAAIYAARANL